MMTQEFGLDFLKKLLSENVNVNLGTVAGIVLMVIIGARSIKLVFSVLDIAITPFRELILHFDKWTNGAVTKVLWAGYCGAWIIAGAMLSGFGFAEAKQPSIVSASIGTGFGYGGTVLVALGVIALCRDFLLQVKAKEQNTPVDEKKETK